MKPYRPLLFAALLATPVTALELPADARLVAERAEALDVISFPSAPLEEGIVESLAVEGQLLQQAWQLPATGLSTMQMLAPLRSQLEETGFTVLLDCADRNCGGFEFRYEMDLLPEPAMHVDLGDYLYLLARQEDGKATEYVALTISRTSERGFIHVTRAVAQAADDSRTEETSSQDAVNRPKPRSKPVGAVILPALPELEPAPAARSEPSKSIPERLESTGRSVLSDLTFETGSAQLSDTPFKSLEELAAWMEAHPTARIVLVGHTDSEGALESNISLSRKRAVAVKERLKGRYGIAGSRIAAEGVGFLAPLASNATDSGRTLNRRVEAVLVDDE